MGDPKKKRMERKICCCFASSWTKVIAIIQIVWFAMSGTKIIFNFVEFKLHDDFDSPIDDNHFPVHRLILLCVALGPGILMGLILLWGSFRRRPCYLTIWTLHAIICLILFTLMAAIKGTIFKGIIRTALVSMGIWVVQVTKGEYQSLEEDSERDKLTSKKPRGLGLEFDAGQGNQQGGGGHHCHGQNQDRSQCPPQQCQGAHGQCQPSIIGGQFQFQPIVPAAATATAAAVIAPDIYRNYPTPAPPGPADRHAHAGHTGHAGHGQRPQQQQQQQQKVKQKQPQMEKMNQKSDGASYAKYQGQVINEGRFPISV